MKKGLFLLQSHKFSTDSINGTLVYSKCDGVFKKQFPLDLEGQTIEFRCPVCNLAGEADISYKPVDERDEIDEDLTDPTRKALKSLMKVISNNMLCFCNRSPGNPALR
jgi:hypothetical protein